MSASNSKLAPSGERPGAAARSASWPSKALRDARRICDTMLVGWLKYSNDEALSS